MNAVRIAVDPEGGAWVLTADAAIFRRQKGVWQQQPGRATDLAVGPDGSLWAIGAPAAGAGEGRPVLRWTGGGWEPAGGDAVRVAVGPDGLPWVVNAHHVAYRLTLANQWEELPGAITDIAVGADGSAWAIGAPAAGAGEGRPVLRWTGGGWEPAGAAAVRVAVGPDGLPWVVNAHHVVHRLTPANQWEELPGRAIDIAVGPEGSVWTIGAPAARPQGGQPIFRGNAKRASQWGDPSLGRDHSAGRPLEVQVETTSNCNLKCKMCRLTLGDTITSLEPGHMDEAIWEHVCEVARKVGSATVVGYGEPTTNPRFLQMLRDLDERGVTFAFATNGTKVRREFVAQLTALKHLAQVNVSIDSPDPVIYRAIRGGDLDRALEGLKLLREGLPPRVCLGVSAVVMESNLQSLVAFPPLLAELGIKFFMLTPLNGIGAAYENDHLYNQNSHARFLDEIRASCLALGIEFQNEYEHRMKLDLGDPEAARCMWHDRAEFSAKQTRQCLLPWTYPYVDKGGNVHPCFNGDQTSVMGNLRETSFEAIWNGERYQRFRKDLRGGRALPAICRKCNVFPVGPHPLNAYSARLLRPQSRLRGRVALELALENTGTQPWTRQNPLEVRPFGGRASAHYHPTWIAPNRVCHLVEDRVLPGETGTFRFQATPAALPEPETFQVFFCSGSPEDGCWLPNTQFDLRPAEDPEHPVAEAGSDSGRPAAAASPSEGPAVAYVCHNFPAELPAGELRSAWLTTENRSEREWRQELVQLVIDLDGERAARLDLPHPVPPGDRVTWHWLFQVPKEAGPHECQFELQESQSAGGEPDPTAPGQAVAPPLRVGFDATEQPVTPSRRLRDTGLETYTGSWCWSPGGSVSWSGTGPAYPLFTREARGCRITDLEGRQYVDYLMGSGCALLGYGPERIQRAVEKVLGSGAVLSLAHPLMIEVADLLRQMFPGAEAVTFGKNGSDVCTAAVRMARAHTGRPLVLVCGYHGWHDWYVERFGYAATGVPERGEPLALDFEVNNLEHVAQLFDVHRGRVAAVMLEPAGPIGSLRGPVKDADPVFLKEMTDLAHREGALVIFDELITGFRYRGGSVQQATGIIPDLTCLGKALSAGMPLSALIGRREIFASAATRVFYGPTFMGEVYSLAAAREALTIYREQDVPARVWDFGNRLRAALNQICRGLGVAAEVTGPPFRMLLAFAEADEHRCSLMRTLVQQEVVKRGVLPYQGVFLPSAAHDDEALEVTCRAYRQALEVLLEAMAGNRFASYLEIPPLTL